jgi:hypothetical protein
MQQQGFGFGGVQEALLIFLCVIGVILAIALAIGISYLLTLQTALSRVAPRNRLMEPGMVWLSLIPCFNIVWAFFIASRVPGSLRNEFMDRGRDDGGDYGQSMAMTVAVLNVVSFPISLAGQVPQMKTAASLINGFLSLMSLVLFIMFWVKIYGYSKQLAADDGWRPDRRFDDFDDDYPRGGSTPPPSSDAFREGDPGQYR